MLFCQNHSKSCATLPYILLYPMDAKGKHANSFAEAQNVIASNDLILKTLQLK